MGEPQHADGAVPLTADALRPTLEAANVAIIAFDTEGRVLFVNRRLIDWAGIPPEMVERARLEEMYEQSRQMLAEPYRSSPCFDPADEQAHEVTVTMQDGRVMRRLSTPVRDSQTQHLLGQVLSFIDVTAEDRAARAQRDSEVEAQRRAAELEAARHAVAVASEVKRKFLSCMSHELRTPLNAILGFTQLLALDPARPLSPRQQEHVARITRGGDELLAMIERLLELASIEADQLHLQIADVDPAPLVDAGLESVRRRAQELQVVLHRGICDPICVRADPARLMQVLIHLLSNAVKFSRPGGEVTVSQQRDGDLARFEVRDTGVGIPAHLQPQVFDPFDRLGVEGGPVGGVGVGLSLCRHLIQRMGGNIGVQSDEGKGSTFWFTLLEAAPVANADFPPLR